MNSNRPIAIDRLRAGLSEMLAWWRTRRQIRRFEGLVPPPELMKAARWSLAPPIQLAKLYQLAVDVLRRQVPGDFVECGVYNGGSAATLALALRPQSRRLWLYDSFAGMPPAGDRDGVRATEFDRRLIGSVETVHAALDAVAFPKDLRRIRAGWFEQTFTEPLPETVALLHIDADWYDSVLLCLNTFYDRVADGGIVVLDDFGHWEGCREAFFDFCAARRIGPLLERFGHTQAFWTKGRTHNRDRMGRWVQP